MPAHSRCPYCLGDLLCDDEPVVGCLGCATRHHRACFLEHGGCTIFACGCAEFRDGALPIECPGGLHPFLPLGTGSVSRRPEFLSVTREEWSGSPLRRRPALRLSVPYRVRCGVPLEGRVEAFVPRALHGQGLRLVREALVRRRQRYLPLYRDEAVLSGKARQSWLQRLTPWPQEPQVLLRGGWTRFRFSFDPGGVPWPCDLPQDFSFGYWHLLRLSVVLDFPGPARGTRTHRVLVSHAHERCEVEAALA